MFIKVCNLRLIVYRHDNRSRINNIMCNINMHFVLCTWLAKFAGVTDFVYDMVSCTFP